MNKVFKNSAIFLSIVLIFLYSCQKDKFLLSQDAYIDIQADTIRFDTVFTSLGSFTQSFKIINNNKQKILLSTIKLMGGTNSAYHLNVNGLAASEIHDMEIAANDSVYVFVSVTINPTAAQLPFMVNDSILISYNGNNKLIQLEAFGKNAHFLRNQKIMGNVVWTNDLPYVILGQLQIDSTATLIIQRGCNIYAHADAAILVDGTLQVFGEKDKEVIFTGDRLDKSYRELPASWPGFYFRNSSKNNQFNFSVIKNATSAITLFEPSVNSSPKLILKQCIIDNASECGIFSNNSNLTIDNTLISNCGQNVKIQRGGFYEFTNCTMVSYSTLFSFHSNPVLQLSNYDLQSSSSIIPDIRATFKNCIFWGDDNVNQDEIFVTKEGSGVFDILFDHCLLKNSIDPPNSISNACILNQNPLFDSVDISNNVFVFRTNKDPLAPGIDMGTTTSFNVDIENNPRISGIATDIGCYEKQ